MYPVLSYHPDSEHRQPVGELYKGAPAIFFDEFALIVPQENRQRAFGAFENCN